MRRAKRGSNKRRLRFYEKCATPLARLCPQCGASNEPRGASVVNARLRLADFNLLRKMFAQHRMMKGLGVGSTSTIWINPYFS